MCTQAFNYMYVQILSYKRISTVRLFTKMLQSNSRISLQLIFLKIFKIWEVLSINRTCTTNSGTPPYGQPVNMATSLLRPFTKAQSVTFLFKDPLLGHTTPRERHLCLIFLLKQSKKCRYRIYISEQMKVQTRVI